MFAHTKFSMQDFVDGCQDVAMQLLRCSKCFSCVVIGLLGHFRRLLGGYLLVYIKRVNPLLKRRHLKPASKPD